MISAPLLVDVRGMSMSLPEVAISLPRREVRFVVDAERKKGRSFHMGAYFSKAVMTPGVYDYPAERRIAVLTESPIEACYRDIDEVVRRFPVVFTHQIDLLKQGRPFRELLFGTNWLGVRDEETSAAVRTRVLAKSRLVSFIGSLQHADEGAYRFRREVAEFAVSSGLVDCFGKGIRPVAGKAEALDPYCFSIAMENAISDHYFSEKLVDCLLSDCIPIYYGCPGIGNLFDERGIIRFQNLEELARILRSLTFEDYERLRVHARTNKETAFALRLHNHAGLFSRLAEAMLESDLPDQVGESWIPNRVLRFWRQVASRSRTGSK